MNRYVIYKSMHFQGVLNFEFSFLLLYGFYNHVCWSMTQSKYELEDLFSIRFVTSCLYLISSQRKQHCKELYISLLFFPHSLHGLFCWGKFFQSFKNFTIVFIRVLCLITLTMENDYRQLNCREETNIRLIHNKTRAYFYLN